MHLLEVKLTIDRQIQCQVLGEETSWVGVFPQVSHPFLNGMNSCIDLQFSCVLLNPEFSGSPVLKEFLLS